MKIPEQVSLKWDWGTAILFDSLSYIKVFNSWTQLQSGNETLHYPSRRYQIPLCQGWVSKIHQGWKPVTASSSHNQIHFPLQHDQNHVLPWPGITRDIDSWDSPRSRQRKLKGKYITYIHRRNALQLQSFVLVIPQESLGWHVILTTRLGEVLVWTRSSKFGIGKGWNISI